jgi:PAS domain S-box-containing protein
VALIEEQRQDSAGLWERDITGRRRATEERERLLAALDRERRMLQVIIENTPTHLAYLDSQFNFVMVNSAYAAGMGCAAEQLIGRSYFEYFPDEEHRAIFERVRRTGEPVKFAAEPFEFPDRPETGTIYWDWTLAPVKDAVGEIRGLVISLMDVTEQEQARQRLRRYAERLRTLRETDRAILAAHSLNGIAESTLSSVPQLLEGCIRAGIVLYDCEHGVVSLLAVQAQGETRLGMGWHGPIGPEWAPALDVLIQGKPYVIEDLQAVPATSAVVRVLQAEGIRARVIVPLLVEGELIGSLDLGMRDPGCFAPEQMEVAVELADELALGIRQARLNEQVWQHTEELEVLVARRTTALQDREARLQAIFDNTALGIAIVDLAGRLLESNRALQTMLGYSGEQLEGMYLAELTYPKDVETDTALRHDLVAGEKDSYAVEKRYIQKDGQIVQARLRFSLVRNSRHEPRFGIALVEDISQQRQAQEALTQAEKLSATGQLVASLTHEINNPMQSVIGCLGLAQESLEAGEKEEARELLQVVAEELQRATEFVSNLRDLNRPSDPDTRKLVDVNLQLKHILVLTEEQCQKRGVEVEWEPAGGPAPSLVPNCTNQVFLNLVLNALDAMPTGGRLRVCADCTGDPAGVRVAFADTGCGIAPEAIPRLFSPFYTTKPEGLGLGLYITRNIVEECGGRIEVESVLGEGTTFTVWLPALQKPGEGDAR